jgi:hypothetical protein
LFGRLALTAARFLTAAWVGAALMFVVQTVRLIVSKRFESVTLDVLAVLRFPIYYRMGFWMVGAALLCTLLALGGALSLRRRLIAAGLLAASLGVMTYDFRNIYLPMAALVTPPGQARTAEFRALHVRSERINTLHVGLACLAGFVLLWPGAATQSTNATTPPTPQA